MNERLTNDDCFVIDHCRLSDSIRVIDESGEDYLFAKQQFAFVNTLRFAVRTSKYWLAAGRTGR